jgi:hypothetical protein
VGLDAAVYCNCWRDGKTAEPPIPREWVNVDEDGWVWNSNPTWPPGAQEGTPEYDQAMAKDIAFDVWKVNGACSHENMQLVHERIANWSGVGGLRQALREAGESEFATVLAELPEGNGGHTPSALALRMVEEIDRFLALLADGRSPVPPYGFRTEDARTRTIEAIQTVCRVSVESGNPVAWL